VVAALTERENPFSIRGAADASTSSVSHDANECTVPPANTVIDKLNAAIDRA
jgi:hypothetical protein